MKATRTAPVTIAGGIALLVSGMGTSSGSAEADAPPVPLRVMTFNIEWGGTHVSFDKVVEVIGKAAPDVVAVQEPQGNLARLAGEFGWHYDLRNHVISKHPLVDPPGAEGHYLLVEREPGAVVALANVHLPSDPYGEDWIREGRPAADILSLERRTRLPAIEPVLGVLPALVERGIPVFLAGDFNSPSHEDWTPTWLSRFPDRRYPLDWPVSRAVAAAGFGDSFRDVHPDPATRPGFTWFASRPRIRDYNPTAEDAWQSRIDFVWYAGPATVTASRIAGEPGAVRDELAVSPWPSDHRAVVSDFAVVPAPMPVLVAAEKRRYRGGEAVAVRYRNATRRGALVITPEVGDATASHRVSLSKAAGTIALSDGLPGSGRQRLDLLDVDGNVVATSHTWLVPDEAAPTLAVDTHVHGEVVLRARWRNAPGNRYDWIAVYDAAESDPRSFVAWSHIDAAIAGCVEIAASLPRGRYVARLLEDDGFEVLAQSDEFAVE